MKSKDRAALHELSTADLQARLREAQEKLFRLKFRHVGTPLKNPMEIRWFRRDIARLKTLLKKGVAVP